MNDAKTSKTPNRNFHVHLFQLQFRNICVRIYAFCSKRFRFCWSSYAIQFVVTTAESAFRMIDVHGAVRRVISHCARIHICHSTESIWIFQWRHIYAIERIIFYAYIGHIDVHCTFSENSSFSNCSVRVTHMRLGRHSSVLVFSTYNCCYTIA